MLLQEKLKSKKVLLASGSPRRKQLLSGLDIHFDIVQQDVEETWPIELKGGDIAEYLAQKKSMAYNKLQEREILLTADTIVWHENNIMNKPIDDQEAKQMLNALSGSVHEVYTGVCIRTTHEKFSFYDKSTVTIRPLKEEEINYYIRVYKPLDKAGSWGAQDWLGYVAMEKIEGCYYNVMGFPLRRIYAGLMNMF